MSTNNSFFPVNEEFAKNAWIDNAKYLQMYEQSVKDPEGFWGEQGKRIDWIKPYTKEPLAKPFWARENMDCR